MSTVLATMRPSVLGRMWRRMMCAVPEPMTRARSTNARSLIDSVCDRTIRAVDAQLVRPMTMTMTYSVVRMPKNSASLPIDLAQDRGQDERQDERRQDEEEVGDAHQAGIGEAADEPRDDARAARR